MPFHAKAIEVQEWMVIFYYYLSADTSFLIKLVDDMLKNKSDITTLY